MITILACGDRPSNTFQNLAEHKKFQVKTMFNTGAIVGLTEWIIVNKCLLMILFWKDNGIQYFLW